MSIFIIARYDFFVAELSKLGSRGRTLRRQDTVSLRWDEAAWQKRGNSTR